MKENTTALLGVAAVDDRAGDGSRAANSWEPDMRQVPCGDPDCIGAAHNVDVADDEDEAFHTAFEEGNMLWSVRITRFESDNWVLQVETETAIGVIFAQSLVDCLTRAIGITKTLNAKRGGTN